MVHCGGMSKQLLVRSNTTTTTTITTTTNSISRKKMNLGRALILSAVIASAAAFSVSMTSSLSSTTSSTTAIDRRSFVGTTAAGIATCLVAGGGVTPASAAEDGDPYVDFTTTESGMKYKTLKEGDGAIPLPNQTVKAHYTGWLDGFDSIRKFDSSRDRGRPFTFKVGAGQVIRGWDEAFSTMKVGERRQIVLPSRLAYGDRGAGGIIPGGATLYFDVELLGIL